MKCLQLLSKKEDGLTLPFFSLVVISWGEVRCVGVYAEQTTKVIFTARKSSFIIGRNPWHNTSVHVFRHYRLLISNSTGIFYRHYPSKYGVRHISGARAISRPFDLKTKDFAVCDTPRPCHILISHCEYNFLFIFTGMISCLICLFKFCCDSEC